MFIRVTHAQIAPTDSNDELKELKEKIAWHESHIEALRTDEVNLQKNLSIVENELGKIGDKQTSLAAALRTISESVETLEKSVAELGTKLSTERGRLQRRTVAIYKLYHRASAIDYLVRAGSSTDLLRRANYLTFIAKSDRDSMQRLQLALVSAERAKEEVVSLQATRTAQKEKLKKIETILAQKREEQRQLFDTVQEKRALEEQSLQELQQQATRLERSIAVLTGLKSASKAGQKTEPLAEDTLPSITKSAPAPYNGQGLAALRGKLSQPVAGRIVEKFGARKHEEFRDMLFNKGIEMTAAVGSKVRVVAPGRVIFTTVLPGYGNVIIIDHGKRYYSLYGRVASSMVQVGRDVKKDEVIAVLGEGDAGHGNFYFELREQGKAIDPVRYFGKVANS